MPFDSPFFRNLFATAQQVLILYILITVGFVADKLGIYTEKASRLNTNLLFYIVTPMVIVNSFISMDNSPEHIKGLGLAILCSFGYHFIGMAPLPEDAMMMKEQYQNLSGFLKVLFAPGYFVMRIGAVLERYGITFILFAAIAFVLAII